MFISSTCIIYTFYLPYFHVVHTYSFSVLFQQAVANETTLFHFLRNEWSFSPSASKEECWIDFNVQFAFKSLLYTHTASLFFDDVVLRMVSAFEKRCLDTYDSYQHSKKMILPNVQIPIVLKNSLSNSTQTISTKSQPNRVLPLPNAIW